VNIPYPGRSGQYGRFIPLHSVILVERTLQKLLIGLNMKGLESYTTTVTFEQTFLDGTSKIVMSSPPTEIEMKRGKQKAHFELEMDLFFDKMLRVDLKATIKWKDVQGATHNVDSLLYFYSGRDGVYINFASCLYYVYFVIE